MLCFSLCEFCVVYLVVECVIGMCNFLVGIWSYVIFFFIWELNSVFIELLINGVWDLYCKGFVICYWFRKLFNIIDKKKNIFWVKCVCGLRLYISVFECFSVDGEKVVWMVVVSVDVN